MRRTTLRLWELLLAPLGYLAEGVLAGAADEQAGDSEDIAGNGGGDLGGEFLSWAWASGSEDRLARRLHYLAAASGKCLTDGRASK